MTRPSSCDAAAIDTVDDYASFVKMVERRNRLAGGSWSRKWLAWGPCPQPRCRNTSTTSRCAGCTIQVAGHSYSVPSRLIGKEVQIRLYPTGRKCTTRATGWNGWNGCVARKPTSITATSLGPWCASLVPSPATVPGASVSHHALQADLRSLRDAGSVPTWSTCGSCTWRPPPWKPRWTAAVAASGSGSALRLRGNLAEPKVPEAPVLVWSGKPDLAPTALTVSLVAAGVCA